MNEELLKRLKSFGWRFGLFMALNALTFISDNIPSLELPEIATMLVIYMANEGTKFINNETR